MNSLQSGVFSRRAQLLHPIQRVVCSFAPDSEGRAQFCTRSEKVVRKRLQRYKNRAEPRIHPLDFLDLPDMEDLPRINIFPCRITPTVSKIQQPQNSGQDLIGQEDMRIVAFLIFVKVNIVHFGKVEFCQRFRSHFKNSLKDSESFKEIQFHRKYATFTHVWRRLTNARDFNSRKNADLRVGFRFNNYILLNRWMTLGQQTVEPQTRHVYQTTAVPIYVFMLKSAHVQEVRTDRRFREEDQGYYER